MRLNIFYKIMLLGSLGLFGMLILGGIGYLSTNKIHMEAETALQRNTEIRRSLTKSYDQALNSESVARKLSDLNRRLIELMEMVISGPRHGITEQQLMAEAQKLNKEAQLVKTVPGHERLFKGTKFTIGDVTISNFDDIAAMFEFDMPDYYAAKNSPEEFKRLQGEMAITLANTYRFISRNLEELSHNSVTEVQVALEDLHKAQNTTTIEMQEIQQNLLTVTRQTGVRLLIVFMLTIIILAISFTLFARNMTKPLHATVAMANSLQLGHVAARLQLGKRNDEFGDMSNALNQFAEDLEHEVVAAMQKLAEGNFNINLQPKDHQDLIRTALRSTADQLSTVIAEILQTSDHIALSSQQVASGSQILSEGATSSAASLEEVSSSMNEMASQISQSAENASQANQLSTEASLAAEKGNRQMGAMVDAMTEIDIASQSIAKIIKVIDEIAFQTNLLALNAAVEAARAGQHGKGFAVVAEEVRNLAARSANAARETAELIEGSVEKTQNGAQIAKQTSHALEEIVSSITKVSDLVAEIASASNEQAQGISQINIGLNQIDQGVQQSTATAEESASAAEQLNSQSAQLKYMLERFTLNQTGRSFQPERNLLPETTLPN
jgi:methyl-accepting chemotaxis protein